MDAILRAQAKDMKERWNLDLKDRFIDGTFVVVKGMEKTKREKCKKIMGMEDSSGFSITI